MTDFHFVCDLSICCSVRQFRTNLHLQNPLECLQEEWASFCLWFEQMTSLLGRITDGWFRAVHSSAPELRGIEFPDSPSVSCPLSVTPLYESPCQSLWSQTTLFYCMDMSLLAMLTEGFSRFSRSKVKKKKITPLKEKLLQYFIASGKV